MSELTPCNLCNWEAIVRRAEKRGATATKELMPLHHEMGGWWKVTVSDDDKAVAWLQEIPDRCVC